MSRNGSGTYIVPHTFASGGTILASDHNDNYGDIGNEITNSLPRDGQAGMIGQFRAAAGAASAPGLSFASDTNTGRFHKSADTMADACGGSEVVEYSTAGINVTGAIKQRGFNLIPVGFGPVPWSGLTAPSGWVFVGRAYSRSSYPDLWSFAQTEIANGNTFYGVGDGSTTFTVGANMPGRVPACNDSISGSAAGVLTSATMNPDGATVGATGGEQKHTLTGPELPAVSPTWSGTPATINVSSTVGDVLRNPGGVQTGSGLGTGFGVGSGPGGTTGYSISSNGAYTPQGTVGNLGAGQAHNTVQPTIVVNYIVFAGAQ